MEKEAEKYWRKNLHGIPWEKTVDGYFGVAPPTSYTVYKEG